MKMNNCLKGLSVLIVEDEFLLAVNLETIMRDAGAQNIRMAATVVDATILIERGAYDAAILDIRLMDGDSLPLAEKLIDRGVPVVIHSGYTNPSHSQILPEAVFLPKPAAPTEIIEALLKACGVPGAIKLSAEV